VFGAPVAFALAAVVAACGAIGMATMCK
jgi:hypothetical protein